VGNSSQKWPQYAKMMSLFIMPLKHVLSAMGLVDHLGTPKLWAIAHENGHTRKKDKFFCRSSLECTDYHIPYKSPWNPKTMGNNSQKRY
jgi:hypothetical protein